MKLKFYGDKDNVPEPSKNKIVMNLAWAKNLISMLHYSWSKVNTLTQKIIMLFLFAQ